MMAGSRAGAKGRAGQGAGRRTQGAGAKGRAKGGALIVRTMRKKRA